MNDNLDSKAEVSASDEVTIKITWHLSPSTNRWIAEGPLNFRYGETVCDEPLEASKRRLREVRNVL